MDKNLLLNFKQFRKVGSEQWLASSFPPQRWFVRLFGPLGVHARIRNARMINTIRGLNLPSEARILDAGCGHAYASFWLARTYPAWEITAIELDNELVIANKLIAEKQALENIHFVKCSLSELNMVAAFDLIISVDVLEHVMDDLGILQHFRRALRPGGRLLLHLPRRHQDQWRFFLAFRNHTVSDHVRDEYTEAEISAKLIECGFEVLSLNYGFGRLGEIAFELNNLFWNIKFLRFLTALVLHPLSVWLAYQETRQNHTYGNSLVILAHPFESLGNSRE